MLILEDSYLAFDDTQTKVYRCECRRFTGAKLMSFYPAVVEHECGGIRSRVTWEGFNRDVLKDPDQ